MIIALKCLRNIVPVIEVGITTFYDKRSKGGICLHDASIPLSPMPKLPVCEDSCKGPINQYYFIKMANNALDKGARGSHCLKATVQGASERLLMESTRGRCSRNAD